MLRTSLSAFDPKATWTQSRPMNSSSLSGRSNVRQTFSEPPFTTPPDGTPQVATFSKTKGGWTVGAGVEAGLWGNWTVKAEYLYAQFDGETVSGSFTGGVGVPRGATLANSVNDIHFQVARVGLNYRFGGP